MSSVAIVDDHWLARSAVGQLLQQVCPEMPRIEAASGRDLFSQLSDDHELRLVLLDLCVPGENAWSTLRSIRKRQADTRVVILSMSEDRGNVLRALDEGAVGYIPKSANPESIVSSVRRVLAGEVALPQNLLVSNEPKPDSPYVDDDEIRKIAVAFGRMTPRQREVFELMADSPKNQDIAAALSLSVNTVRVHVQAVAVRLNVPNREQIAHLASRWRSRASSGAIE